MYTLKSIAQRGTTLVAAIALAVGTVLPAIIPSGAAFADSLNPLTKRSLTLSSSSPGWAYTDGSGNSTYAPPNSGANGKQTGNTFQFNTSTPGSTSPIQAMTFQYCTTSAGTCTAPGNDTGSPRTDSVTSQQADLNVNFPSPVEVGDTSKGGTTGDFATVVNTTSGNVQAVPGYNSGISGDPASAAAAVTGNFVVYYDDAGTWTQSTGWTLTTSNLEAGATTPTGKMNYITLTNTSGLNIPADTTVKVVFFGTTNDYITNPGEGAFFVKINTYSDSAATTIIDGGVTVANVMNQSIQITTKVLETMQFSVGTVDPDTLSDTDGSTTTQSAFEAAIGQAADNNATKHGTCNPVVTGMTPTSPANVLQLGDQNAESSLSTDHTYITHSYWRLSSNSSAGATVYYSGHTLTNTEGDSIKPIGATAAAPTAGSEQFGLAIDNATSAPYAVDYSQERTGATDNGQPYENAADNDITAIDPTTLTDMTVSAGPPVVYNASWHMPQLAPLVAGSNYAHGSGTINGGSGTSFAFDPTSDTIPVPIADESSSVVDCVTAKMRYIANIAATTPAGIYTTKVNYIAAPQY